MGKKAFSTRTTLLSAEKQWYTRAERWWRSTLMSRQSSLGVPAAIIDEQAEIERRERAYRDGREPLSLERRIVLLINDGLATDSTSARAVARKL